MSEDIQIRLRNFACRLLEACGGLVDWPAEAPQGEAVLTREAAQTLGVGESFRLTSRPDGDTATLCVSLATDFLDRAAALLAGVPRTCALRLPEMYLKRGGLEEAINRTFTWQNARVTIGQAMTVETEYQTWSILATVRSEDCWEQVISFTLNAASGAEVALGDPLAISGSEPADSSRDESVFAEPTALEAALQVAGFYLDRRMAEFIVRMEGRLERDRRRLRDYYGALLKQEGGRKSKSMTEETEEQRAAKVKAVKLELQRKLLELEERYGIEARLTPLTLIRTRMSVLTVECHAQRKQARRSLRIYWNPILKALEPLACGRCGISMTSVFFEDQGATPLCGRCYG